MSEKSKKHKKIKYKFEDIFSPSTGTYKCASMLRRCLKDDGSILKVHVHSNHKKGEYYVYTYDEIPKDSFLESSFLKYIGFEEVEKVYEEKVTKLPPKEPKNINWKSRNRGGGVHHKNFDTAPTKKWDYLSGGTLPSGDIDNYGGLG